MVVNSAYPKISRAQQPQLLCSNCKKPIGDLSTRAGQSSKSGSSTDTPYRPVVKQQRSPKKPPEVPALNKENMIPDGAANNQTLADVVQTPSSHDGEFNFNTPADTCTPMKARQDKLADSGYKSI